MPSPRRSHRPGTSGPTVHRADLDDDGFGIVPTASWRLTFAQALGLIVLVAIGTFLLELLRGWTLVLLLLVGVLSTTGAFTAYVARQNGRSTRTWFVAGCFLPLLALLAVGLAPPAMSPAPPMKNCRWCGEPIRESAIICRYCGRQVTQS